jgi:low affinity Fe/Cu permease
VSHPFDRFAEWASRIVSGGGFFAVSVLAFLLIALLQNSERRYDAALHHKIDAVLTGIADLMDHLEDEDPERMRRHVERLRTSVRIERKL